MFKQEEDYAFADCDFSGTTAEEVTTLMEIFQARRTEVYIADYQHLGVYACRILVPGMSDIYPVEDLLLANNAIAIDLRARHPLSTALQPVAAQARYLALIEQMDALSLNDFARVRELLGLATGRDNGWFTLRVGELKAMLALSGGDHEQALMWTEWTRDFNALVFSAERDNYYRCLHTVLQLKNEGRRTAAFLSARLRPHVRAPRRSPPPHGVARAGENPDKTCKRCRRIKRCWLRMKNCSRLSAAFGRCNGSGRGAPPSPPVFVR